MHRSPHQAIAGEAEIEYEIGEDFDELLEIEEDEDEFAGAPLAALAGRPTVDEYD